MPRSVYHLSDLTGAGLDRVEFACSRCSRRGVYRTATLAARFGADASIPAIIAALAADCPRRRDVPLNLWERCDVACPTLLRVAGKG